MIDIIKYMIKNYWVYFVIGLFFMIVLFGAFFAVFFT